MEENTLTFTLKLVYGVDPASDSLEPKLGDYGVFIEQVIDNLFIALLKHLRFENIMPVETNVYTHSIEITGHDRTKKVVL